MARKGCQIPFSVTSGLVRKQEEEDARAGALEGLSISDRP